MKYTLVLGIAYKKYKNPGDIAVYVGGRLIDAFQIDQDVAFVHQDTVTSLLDETWYSRLDINRWISTVSWPQELMPKLFKIYEIEEQDLNGLVEIKVDNSHNDHTNGFMKNSSMIRFPMIGLFPNHFIENKGEQLMRIVKRFDDGLFKHEKRAGRNEHSDTRSGTTWTRWPCVNNFYVRRQSEKFEQSKELNGYCWIGGDFTVEIPIKTKHRIKYLSSMSARETGFFVKTPDALILATCKLLLNIYNEDQRSNRTKD